MSLSAVFLTHDLRMACLQLALSTEKEEVIGLLLGETKNVNGNEEAHISSLMIPRRSDKKKDRVEISDEQLVLAADYAASLADKLGCKLRVLGWYHSHPHITVWPSHVDVNTQAMYQMMDRGFVGIICSVFSEDKSTKDCEIQMTCFQSKNINPDDEAPHNIRVDVPLFIKPSTHPASNCLETICDLQGILHMEEMDCYNDLRAANLDLLTAVHNELVLTKTLYHIIDTVSLPLLKTLEQQLVAYKQRISLLEKELLSFKDMETIEDNPKEKN
ncbi:lys-63-specific deubiquitinase BRCC36-like [Lycorma delicatula]|uniref:lys-63-specific deubiquitinase BRCC36-like n=1 Tax=Lycorma delicatula TaxID=130591 RepID=UPI003F518BBE